MYSRQLEQLASQRGRELDELRKTGRTPAVSLRPSGTRIRTQTGWALVSIGLRLAESGSR